MQDEHRVVTGYISHKDTTVIRDTITDYCDYILNINTGIVTCNLKIRIHNSDLIKSLTQKFPDTVKVSLPSNLLTKFNSIGIININDKSQITIH